MIPSFRRYRSVRTNRHPRHADRQRSLERLEDRTLTAVDFRAVDLSALVNVRVHDLQPACRSLPAGDVVLGGVPFTIPAVGPTTWWGTLASGASPHVLDVPVGVEGVDEVDTLINSAWGQPGPASYAALEFHGTNGAFYRKDLIGNDDIRDHFFGFSTNFINNTTTVNVATSGGGFFNECRFDKQRIDLPDAFLTAKLDFIRVIDSGWPNFQNVMLTGVTVGVRRSPDVVAASLALDPAQGGVNFAYRVAESPLTQDTTVALYWATGPTLADRVGGPVFQAPVQRALGEYGPVHVPAEVLGARPGATHLLLVADPDGLVAEGDEQNNVFALQVPRSDIAVLDATTPDFQTVGLRYRIANWAAPAFGFQAYLSADAQFDPGVDRPLEGGLNVTNFDLRRANPDGSARTYSATFTLGTRAPVGDAERFVLVVADPGFAAEPDGAASRTDNVAFAVPLVAAGERINRVGDKGVANGRAEELDRTRGSGPFTGAILRGTDDFERLRSLEDLWAPSPPFVFYGQTELLDWQRQEDTLVQESLLGPVDRLVHLLRAEMERAAGTWDGARFSIDEAYDSLGTHGIRSPHYEGRALDLSVIQGGVAADTERLGRLAGLAWLAGFDWVTFDEAGHVHVSERAAFDTTISQASLQQAVAEAHRLGLIEQERVTDKLLHKLDGLDRALERGHLFAAALKLHNFRDAILAQRDRHHADRAFAGQIVQDVDLLLSKLHQQMCRGWLSWMYDLDGRRGHKG